MKPSDRAEWLSSLYAVRGALHAAKTVADVEREFSVAARLATAAEAVTLAIETVEEKPSVFLPVSA